MCFNPMLDRECFRRDPAQQHVVLAVECRNLFRSERCSNATASTDTPAPGFSCEWYGFIDEEHRLHSKMTDRPLRHNRDLAGPIRAGPLRIVPQDKLLKIGRAH